MYPISATYSASTACAIAGIDRPDRLRSWHVREGLKIGTSDGAGGHRRYSFADCVELRFVKEFTDGGLAVGLARDVLVKISEYLRTSATVERASLYATPTFLVVAVRPDDLTVETVEGSCGEAGPVALRLARGGAPVVLTSLSDIVIRAQAALEIHTPRPGSNNV